MSRMKMCILFQNHIGEGVAYTLGQFPPFLVERDQVCSKAKFSNLPTSQFLAKSSTENVI
jgi:topoisomerase IA-like protein